MQIDMPTQTRMLVMVSFYLLSTLTVVIPAICIEKRGISSLGFTKEHLAKQILIGLVIFIVLCLANIIPLLIGVNKNEILNFKPKNVTALIFFLLYDIFCVGFGEEFIFRGYFLSRLKELMNSSLWAVLISSVLFGLWHYRYNLNVTQVITATIIGIIFSFLKIKLKHCSTLSLSIAHGLNDAFIILLGWFLL